MAWTTVVAGTTITASWSNTNNRDQVISTFATTAARDAAITAPTTGLFACTTDTNRVWQYNGTAWVLQSWAATAGRPGVILTDAAQTIATATATDITWGTEVSDIDGWTSGGSATLTVPTGLDGRYSISYTATCSAALSGNTSAAFTIAGALAAGVPFDLVQNAAALTITRSLAAAETIKVTVTHNAGANRDFVSRLEITWLGR